MTTFRKILFLLLLFLFSIENLNAQLYKGVNFDATFDGGPKPGGVLYSYNDLYITAVIKGIYDDPVACNSNFPKYRKDPPKLYRFYIELTVSNAGKYPIRFMGVPTFGIYLKATKENSAGKVCTNIGTRPGSISMDLRTIGPNGKMVFKDVSNGGLFMESPSIFKFKMSHYKVLNPNIKKDVWPSENYRDYAKKIGKPISSSISDLDDFAKGLEQDINRIGDEDSEKSSQKTRKQVQQQVRNKAQKVSKNKSKNKNTSNLQNYDSSLCNKLKNDVERVYKSILSFVQKATDPSVRNAFSQTQVLTNSMDRFSKEYYKAVKGNKISPKCQRIISAKMETYSDKFIKHLQRYTGKQFKN